MHVVMSLRRKPKGNWSAQAVMLILDIGVVESTLYFSGDVWNQ